MVDKRKVAMMTRVAREEKKNHKRTAPAVNFFMFDYVLLQVIKGVFAITLMFLAVAGCYLGLTMEQWIAESTWEDLIGIGWNLGKIYLILLVISIVFLSLIYSLRYVQAKQLAEEQEHLYRRLNRYYEKRRR